MKLTFPIKTVSESNMREHWRTKSKRKIKQKADFRLLWRNFRPRFLVPATITFTRYSCQILDDDNLAGAFKFCRDVIASEIGVDDGSSEITWLYRQERISKRIHYFTVEITKVN